MNFKKRMTYTDKLVITNTAVVHDKKGNCNFLFYRDFKKE